MSNQQTEQDVLQIAIKYGVPTPETCKALKWKEPTFFRWFDNTLCTYENWDTRHVLRCVKTANVVCDMTFPEIGIYAPQMHEIAQRLPNVINIPKHNYVGGCPFLLCNENKQLHYHNNHHTSGFDLIVDIQNYHYAEAYASLHLKLKQAGLLPEKGGNND